MGKSYQDLYATLGRFIGSHLSLEEIRQKFIEHSDEKYQQMDYSPLFRKDILAILNFAREKGIKLAVASSSTLSHIEEVLSACSIRDYFDVVMSGESLTSSKPNPEIYRLTVARLGLKTDECIAIEDSTYGIRAGKDAGLTVIAYEEIRMKIDQSQADFKGADMMEILEIISQQL